jgi:hypothetical protein
MLWLMLRQPLWLTTTLAATTDHDTSFVKSQGHGDPIVATSSVCRSVPQQHVDELQHQPCTITNGNLAAAIC